MGPSHGYTKADFAREAGLSYTPLLTEDIPMADAVTWNYVKDGPMVRPELEPELPTHMRKLHKWYLEVAKGEKWLYSHLERIIS